MMKILFFCFGLALFPGVLNAQSDSRVTREMDNIIDSWHERVEAKALEISRRLWSQPVPIDQRKSVDDAMSEFAGWLEAEMAEAFAPFEVDKVKITQAALIVFSSACSHDIQAYSVAWGDFLGIVLKYVAYLGCSAYPATAPFALACQFAGHLVGKYGGQLIGLAIHNGSCGGVIDRDRLEREIRRAGRDARNYDWQHSREWIGFVSPLLPDGAR